MKRGAQPALVHQVIAPPLVSGPQYFPPWFAYYTSGDHAIKFEPWVTPQSPVSPIVEEPDSGDDVPDLVTVTNSSAPNSAVSAYPVSLSDNDPIVSPVKGVPIEINPQKPGPSEL